MAKVLYYLEDRAHEGFVTSLVRRLAQEAGVSVHHDVRSASGGIPRLLGEFKRFIDDLAGSPSGPEWFDMLIVAMDANCNTPQVRRKQIGELVAGTGIEDRLVMCVPDPYIERWYLCDLAAIRQLIKSRVEVDLPPHKCKKNYYKQVLSQVFLCVGSLQGGVEYGEDIAAMADLDRIGAADGQFRDFADAVRSRLRR
jgi:hypothetical protein